MCLFLRVSDNGRVTRATQETTAGFASFHNGFWQPSKPEALSPNPVRGPRIAALRRDSSSLAPAPAFSETRLEPMGFSAPINMGSFRGFFRGSKFL